MKISTDNAYVVKLRAGNYRMPVTCLPQDTGRIYLQFPYNKKLLATVKTMRGAKWHGYDPVPKKMWSIEDCPRNTFQFEHLQGMNPYKHWDNYLKIADQYPTFVSKDGRPLRAHQKELIWHGKNANYGVWAADMGLGKTLSMIETLESIGVDSSEAWYVGPKSALESVKRELNKWDARVLPKLMTYERLVSLMKSWGNKPAPRAVFFDESSRIKNETSQRSQSAYHLSNAVRIEHGFDGYVIEMSGTPAPKTPVDWWHQAEVACPGFLVEGSQKHLKKTLCLTEDRESISGGFYPHVITWKDDDRKCGKCGKFREEHSVTSGHPFIAMKNEVARLHKRLAGLVIVKFKKDCLDLPEIQYEVIRIRPSIETLLAAKTIKKTTTRAVTALTLLRELSDGFQYTEEVVGEDQCAECVGTGKTNQPMLKAEFRGSVRPDDADVLENFGKYYEYAEINCGWCSGTGKILQKKRATDSFGSPKDQYVIDDLDLHEDVGRYILWGGFTGTIDRLVNLCHQQGWTTLRIDGRGFVGSDPTGQDVPKDDLLDAMDGSSKIRADLLERYPKVCVVGHPRSGGMGLTLTAAPTMTYYSNSFDGEARMQSTQRHHRLGMDENRGATVKDLIHLPTDELVLTNLNKKQRLQNLSMGELDNIMEGI